MIFHLFEKYLAPKHPSCKQFAEYGPTICGAIKQMATAFGWKGTIRSSINFVTMNYKLKLVNWNNMPKCTLQWGSNIDEPNKGTETQLALPGMDPPQSNKWQSYLRVSTGNDNNLTPLQNGYIVAGLTIFALFVIWFVYRKFQAGDKYESAKYAVLLDEITLSAEEARV